MKVAREYPTGTSGGACFLSGVARRPDERVIITDKVLVFGEPAPPGLVVICETQVRYMAELLGFVGPDEARLWRAEQRTLRADINDLSASAAMTLRELEAARLSGPRTIYVAPDGSEHASRVALDLHLGIFEPAVAS